MGQPGRSSGGSSKTLVGLRGALGHPRGPGCRVHGWWVFGSVGSAQPGPSACGLVTPSPGAGVSLAMHSGDTPWRGMGQEGDPNSGHLGIMFWPHMEGSAEHRGWGHQGSVHPQPQNRRGGGRTGAKLLPLIFTGPLLFNVLRRSAAGAVAAVGLPGTDEPGGDGGDAALNSKTWTGPCEAVTAEPGRARGAGGSGDKRCFLL